MSAKDVIWGKNAERIAQRLHDLDAELAQYVQNFAYGEIYERQGLDLKTKELLAIVMLVSLGNPSELKTHFAGVVNAGGSVEDIKETLLFALPYLGFPRVIGAFQLLAEWKK